jgi:hypothetical protein
MVSRLLWFHHDSYGFWRFGHLWSLTAEANVAGRQIHTCVCILCGITLVVVAPLVDGWDSGHLSALQQSDNVAVNNSAPVSLVLAQADMGSKLFCALAPAPSLPTLRLSL